MRQWIGPVVSLGLLAAITMLMPERWIWILAGTITALFWYLLLSRPHNRRWEDVKDDHRRASPRSSR